MSASDALDAWFGTFTVDLGYLAVPVELDLSRPEYQPLAALGRSWFSALELGWSLTPDYDVQGVDAKTGQVIRSEPWSWSGLTYDDLEEAGPEHRSRRWLAIRWALTAAPLRRERPWSRRTWWRCS